MSQALDMLSVLLLFFGVLFILVGSIGLLAYAGCLYPHACRRYYRHNRSRRYHSGPYVGGWMDDCSDQTLNCFAFSDVAESNSLPRTGSCSSPWHSKSVAGRIRTTTVIELINIVLLGLLVITALAAIRLHDLFAVTIMFGIYSLLAAAVFVVLDAVDVAFTEAAVGVWYFHHTHAGNYRSCGAPGKTTVTPTTTTVSGSHCDRCSSSLWHV